MGEDGLTGPRVKFTAHWLGTVDDCLSTYANYQCQSVYHNVTTELAAALRLLERVGAAPVLADGKVAGNAAARIHAHGSAVDLLVVSRSGKLAGHTISVDSDFCIVTRFNQTDWTVDYYAPSADILPTSDTPLHYVALHCAEQFGWDAYPSVSLHGHAIATTEAAEHLHLPCSPVETLFSTPEDSYELLSLIKQHQYPQHKIYIRKGHGFMILGQTTSEAVATFEQNILPFISEHE